MSEDKIAEIESKYKENIEDKVSGFIISVPDYQFLLSELAALRATLAEKEKEIDRINKSLELQADRVDSLIAENTDYEAELADWNNRWRDVDGFEGLYKVNSSGDIYSVKRNKIIKSQIFGTGYYGVHLWKDNKDPLKSVARIVAKAFIPNPNNYEQVNHIDGNKLNNHVSNLEWCNASQNMIHASKHGFMGGEKHPRSKLKKSQVIEIRKRAANGEECTAIAKDYDVSAKNIGDIKNNKIWRYI